MGIIERINEERGIPFFNCNNCNCNGTKPNILSVKAFPVLRYGVTALQFEISAQ